MNEQRSESYSKLPAYVINSFMCKIGVVQVSKVMLKFAVIKVNSKV